MVLVNRQQRTEATGHIAHHRRFATHDVHGLRGKAHSIEQYGDITQVPDGWDQPNPTRLAPQGGGGVKTNTRICLQVLFVLDVAQ